MSSTLKCVKSFNKCLGKTLFGFTVDLGAMWQRMSFIGLKSSLWLDFCSTANSKLSIQALEYVSTFWRLVDRTDFLAFGKLPCMGTTLIIGRDGMTFRKPFSAKRDVCCGSVDCRVYLFTCAWTSERGSRNDSFGSDMKIDNWRQFHSLLWHSS